MLAVIHYAEIGTKGDNRSFFENRLAKNIEKQTGLGVEKRYGRLLAEGDKKGIEKLSTVLGISYYAVVEKAGLDIDEIKDKASGIAKKSNANTFRVSSSRSNKNFPLNSQQINEQIGAVIEGKKVDLDNPGLTIFIEITEKESLLYTEKIKCHGGLPVGCAGPVVSLVSGGIDSPVAAFLAAKRGCRPVLVHFHNYTDMKMTGKIEKIASRLSDFIPDIKMYIVPFLFIQEAIIEKILDTHRMVVYRRLMFHVAEKIAEREKAKAFVTGDSVSQVASQTLDNINTIYEAARRPVLAPLLGYDKQEIIDLAKRIDTYGTSILPYQDCCSYMIAEHPATKTSIEEVKEMESGIDADSLVAEAAGRAEIKEFNSN